MGEPRPQGNGRRPRDFGIRQDDERIGAAQFNHLPTHRLPGLRGDDLAHLRRAGQRHRSDAVIGDHPATSKVGTSGARISPCAHPAAAIRASIASARPDTFAAGFRIAPFPAAIAGAAKR